MKQPLDEFNELGGSNTTLDSHEPEFPLALTAETRFKQPRSGAAHHGVLPFTAHVVPA